MKSDLAKMTDRIVKKYGKKSFGYYGIFSCPDYIQNFWADIVFNEFYEKKEKLSKLRKLLKGDYYDLANQA